MKEFKKLALAAAVASLPVSGFAMEALDDSALAGVTGQDGITISLANDISADIIIHDTDGFGANNNSGAIIISGFSQTLAAGTSIDIDIDAGNNGTQGTALNVGITLPNNINIDLGDIQVADSNRTTAGGSWGTTGAATTVMTLGTLVLGTTTLNLQLGHEYQGSMIVMDTIISNGISLSNFSINDAGGAVSGGSIFVGQLTLIDNGGNDLTVDQTIDVDADGLVIEVNQLGDVTNGADLRLANVRLGDNTQSDIGDIEITGLDLTGTITITGH